MSRLSCIGFVVAFFLATSAPTMAGMEEDAEGPLELLKIALGCAAPADHEEDDRLIQRTYRYDGDARTFTSSLSLRDVTPDPNVERRSEPTYIAKAAYKDLASITGRKNFLILNCSDQLECFRIDRTAPDGEHTSKTSPKLTLRICKDSIVDVTDALNELIRLNKL